MMATSSALRQLSAAGVVKNTYPHKKWQSCIPPSAGMCFASCFLAGKWEIPALRPSHPHVCRKRAFRQGQALRGRFAGLDIHALASGFIHSRATDEEASGGGSVKGSSQAGSTKTQKSVFRRSRFFRIPTHGANATCKSVQVYAPQSFPGTYRVLPAPCSYARAVMCAMLAIV